MVTHQTVVTVNVVSPFEIGHTVSVTCSAPPPSTAIGGGDPPVDVAPPRAVVAGIDSGGAGRTEDTRRRATTGPNPTSVQVHEYLAAHAPQTRSEIIAALGGRPKGIDEKLKRLLAKGQIRAEGPPRGRIYHSAKEPVRLPTTTTAMRGKATAPTTPERGVYPLYDAIAELNGATTARLARQTGLPTKLVVEQGQRLLRLGLISFAGDGRERVWRATRPETARDAA